MSDTPETDASCGYALSSHYGRLDGSYLQMDCSGPFVHAEVARKLERERDKAREKYDNLATEHMLVVNKLCKERDDARDALSRINEIFCDGEDTHDDWMKMGNIAKDYFKGLE